MANRINAFASLANQFGQITVSMGGLIIRASSQRERSTYFEDHF